MIRVEAGVRERLRLLRQQRAVRRQRQVEPSSAASIATSRSTSRRTSGSPPVMRILLDAVRDEGAREPLDLLERRAAARAVEELVVAPEDLLRHAVDAAEVAAVGDGDPEIAQRSLPRRVDRVWSSPDSGTPLRVQERRPPDRPVACADARATPLAARLAAPLTHGCAGSASPAIWGCTFVPVTGRGRDLPAVRVSRGPIRHSSIAGALPFAWRSLHAAAAERGRRAARAHGAAPRDARTACRPPGLDLTTVSEHRLHHRAVRRADARCIALVLFRTPVAAAAWVGVALAVAGLLMLSGDPGGSAARQRARARATPSPSRSRSSRWSDLRRGTTPRALTFLQMAVAFVGVRRDRASPEVSRRVPQRRDGLEDALVVTGVFAGALGVPRRDLGAVANDGRRGPRSCSRSRRRSPALFGVAARCRSGSASLGWAGLRGDARGDRPRRAGRGRRRLRRLGAAARLAA
mgnify:CR=1 FL=1